MAIDVTELLFTARELLTELPEAVHFSRENMRALIRPAIFIWQERTNDNPAKRQNFIVESSAIQIVAGIADIGPEIDARGYRIEFIKESDIVMAYGAPNFAVKFVNSLNRLLSIGRQDKFHILAYLSGREITFRDAGEVEIDTINGSFMLRSVVLPSDPATMNPAFMPELALIMADLAKAQIREQNRGLDIPPK